MSKLNNVTHLGRGLTHAQAIQQHLDELDDDQKNAIVTEFVVAFRNRGDEGVGFNVAMGDDTMCVVGLLETIKTFLLLAQIEGV